MATIDNSMKFGCSIVNSSLYCQKQVISSIGDSDVYFLSFKILQNNLELTKISSPLLVYSKSTINLINHFTIENNTILSTLPFATLINNVANVTISVDENTFLRNLTIDSEIYCKDSNSNKWKATMISRKEVNCLIPYNDHNSTIIHLGVVLSAPSYSISDISLTKNSIPFYYLIQNSISFSTLNETQFEYTSSYLAVNVSINIGLPENLKKNIVCKMSDSDFDHITKFSYSTGNQHYIICNFTTENTGSKNISIWYKDEYHQFPISNNNLELIFVTKQAITAISPTGIKVNKTKEITIDTLFDTTINYGNGREYYCEYGLFNQSGTFVPVISVDGGKFKCSVIILTGGSAFINIYLKTKNIYKSLNLKTENFRVVDGNILEPSYATLDGGKKVFINDYEVSVSFNAKFKKSTLYDKYDFNCTKNGTTLTCITPKIINNDILPFSSEFLMLTNNNTIASAYILYGLFKFNFLTFSINRTKKYSRF